MSHRLSVRAAKAGLSRELQLKINSKYDPDLANQCLEWLKDTINTSGQGEPNNFDTNGASENLSEVLHDGTVLARMANALTPGAIPASKLSRPPKLAFKQMELIELFIRKADEFGVPAHENFATVDLYEDQNLHQVVVCLQSLGRKAQAQGRNGFGPKESRANPRHFDEDTLRAGETVIGLQMGTNKGASQAGMTFGKNRMIID